MHFCGFPQQMAHLVLDNLIDSGVDVRIGCVPMRVDKLGEELSVSWRTTDSDHIYSVSASSYPIHTASASRTPSTQQVLVVPHPHSKC